MSRESTPPPAGLCRRLAAMFYDGLLLIGVLFLATLAVLPLTEDGWVKPQENLPFQIYLAAMIYLFFAWFWIHGGQTLGMRAWRLRLQMDDGHRLGWGRALLRLLAALLSWASFGLGYLWVLWDREGLAWHDRLSGTRIVCDPKP